MFSIEVSKFTLSCIIGFVFCGILIVYGLHLFGDCKCFRVVRYKWFNLYYKDLCCIWQITFLMFVGYIYQGNVLTNFYLLYRWYHYYEEFNHHKNLVLKHHTMEILAIQSLLWGIPYKGLSCKIRKWNWNRDIRRCSEEAHKYNTWSIQEFQHWWSMTCVVFYIFQNWEIFFELLMVLFGLYK